MELRVFHIVIGLLSKLLLGHRDSALMLAESIGLLSHRLGLKFLASGKVLLVRKNDHNFLSVLGAELNVPVEDLHIRVGLAKIGVKVSPDSYRIKA